MDSSTEPSFTEHVATAADPPTASGEARVPDQDDEGVALATIAPADAAEANGTTSQQPQRQPQSPPPPQQQRKTVSSVAALVLSRAKAALPSTWTSTIRETADTLAQLFEARSGEAAAKTHRSETNAAEDVGAATADPADLVKSFEEQLTTQAKRVVRWRDTAAGRTAVAAFGDRVDAPCEIICVAALLRESAEPSAAASDMFESPLAEWFADMVDSTFGDAPVGGGAKQAWASAAAHVLAAAYELPLPARPPAAPVGNNNSVAAASASGGNNSLNSTTAGQSQQASAGIGHGAAAAPAADGRSSGLDAHANQHLQQPAAADWPEAIAALPPPSRNQSAPIVDEHCMVRYGFSTEEVRTLFGHTRGDYELATVAVHLASAQNGVTDGPTLYHLTGIAPQMAVNIVSNAKCALRICIAPEEDATPLDIDPRLTADWAVIRRVFARVEATTRESSSLNYFYFVCTLDGIPLYISDPTHEPNSAMTFNRLLDMSVFASVVNAQQEHFTIGLPGMEGCRGVTVPKTAPTDPTNLDEIAQINALEQLMRPTMQLMHSFQQLPCVRGGSHRFSRAELGAVLRTRMWAESLTRRIAVRKLRNVPGEFRPYFAGRRAPPPARFNSAPMHHGGPHGQYNNNNGGGYYQQQQPYHQQQQQQHVPAPPPQQQGGYGGYEPQQQQQQPYQQQQHGGFRGYGGY